MNLPKGWTEADVRGALAVNQKNLEDRRTYIRGKLKEYTEELEEIDAQLDNIAHSVANLNQR